MKQLNKKAVTKKVYTIIVLLRCSLFNHSSTIILLELDDTFASALCKFSLKRFLLLIL